MYTGHTITFVKVNVMASLALFLPSFIRIMWVEYYTIFTEHISNYILYTFYHLLVVINYDILPVKYISCRCSLHWIVHICIHLGTAL